MPTIRFLHTADLHLDTPFKGLTQFPDEQLKWLRESTFQAFTNFIRYAVEKSQILSSLLVTFMTGSIGVYARN